MGNNFVTSIPVLSFPETVAIIFRSVPSACRDRNLLESKFLGGGNLKYFKVFLSRRLRHCGDENGRRLVYECISECGRVIRADMSVLSGLLLRTATTSVQVQVRYNTFYTLYSQQLARVVHSFKQSIRACIRAS